VRERVRGSDIPLRRKSAAHGPRRFTLAEKALARLWPHDRRFADSIGGARISSTDKRQVHRFSERFWRGIGVKMRTRHCALFLTSTTDERVIRQFERLRAEARDFVDVYLVVNPSSLPVVPGLKAEELMPLRWAAMAANGCVIPGYLDTIWMPLGLAAPYPYVWMIEFDVDYAGDWSRFFAQFRRNRADLLTTSLTRLADDPRWDHWDKLRAPSTVDAGDWHRDFHPIMRLSQRFMRAYVDQMRSPHWGGHHEFTIPTLAIHLGMQVEDIGAGGLNYTNTPLDPDLAPGSFAYRPARAAYFHERPDTFDQPRMLYHPVKPDWGPDSIESAG
jgi:hypothetical protein